jgi:hypothetical protein
MRFLARALALVWVGFWTLFALAEGREGLSHLPMLLLMLGAIWLAWRREIVGGALLLFLGVSVMIAYPLLAHPRFPLSTVVFVLLTLGLPPLLAGLLLLLGGGRDRASGPA